MSLLKYRNRTDGNGRGRLYWDRADIDGAPFRGSVAPLLREDEFDALSHRVHDTEVEVLDVSIPEEKARLKEILDCVNNGWYQLYRCTEQFVPEKKTWLVFVIYSIPYNEIADTKSVNLQR